MSRLRALMPDGLAGRFAVLLTCALLAANLVALGLLTIERGRLDRAAWTEREIGRITSILPAVEAAAPEARASVARGASSRGARLRVAPEPMVRERRIPPGYQDFARDLADALEGREVRAAIIRRPGGEGGDDADRREAMAVSVRLITPEGAAAQWLNVLSRNGRPQMRGFPEEVFLIVLGVSLASVLGIGLVFVRRLTRPLGALAVAARAAGQGDRSARVPETGAREMREAAAAFNDMQARIARFDAERMRTLAAVGHDLRTPITSLRIRAEMLEPEDGAPMVRTLDEMTVMADGLVAYAKGAADSEPMQIVPLGPLLTRLCDERGGQAAIRREATVQGRRVALGRAFGNLIDNALRYGGSAEVTLDVKGGEAVVTVVDTGPGISPERMETVFEPFVRGDDSRSLETGGAGLGLSIARNIALAHGGRITLENRPGGGLSAELRLPLASEALRL
ncbi:sensor histidine kinase [Roseovarius sp. S4756]|uniref:sensor histidine kinase n=1 Tax=Roseovarius maritimus TaxID=3342637 RepID=UPI003728F495